MSLVEDRLREKGLELPTPVTPVANYVPTVRTGNLVFLSGHVPIKDGQPTFKGRVGVDIDVPTGYQAAQLVTLGLLASLKREIGDLDRVKRVVKVLGLVNSPPEFTQHPEVMNGASDLLVHVFGDRGKHTRSAMGAGSLPRGVAVEIEMIVEVE